MSKMNRLNYADSSSENIFLEGVKINLITRSELKRRVKEIIDHGQKELVLAMNVYGMNLAYRNKWFKTLINSAKIVFCDGYGVKLGAAIFGHKIPERITYAEWIWELSEYCAQQGFSMFFLGAKPNIVREAAKIIQERYPDLKIVGIHHGYFNKTGTESEDVIRLINSVKPNILALGIGMKVQERWLYDHWSQIDANIALGVGSCFDYVSGKIPRCPSWMSENYLEWLYRFLLEPRRMFKRYIIGNPWFLLRMLKNKYFK